MSLQNAPSVAQEPVPHRTLAERSASPSKDIDARLLRWLLHYSLQRVEDIAIGIRATEQTVRRHTQALVDRGLVESVLFSYSSQIRQSWYYLTDTGIAAAAAMENLGPVDAARIWRTDERHLLQLLPRLPTLMTIQNLINNVILEAPTALAFQGSPAAIRWRWQREYEVSFHDARRRTVQCVADAAVVLRRTACGKRHLESPHEEYFVLWMYADLGIAGGWSRALMTARLRQVLLYHESLERQPYRAQFPLVVVLTESALQGERWHQAVYDAAHGLRLGTPLGGVVLNLAEASSIQNRWHACWRTLGTRQPCRLQDLLRPMTRPAIPPGILPHIPPIQAIEHLSFGGATANARIVRGKFQERLAHMATKPMSPSKEREAAALLGLEMSQRYRDVLLLLFAHPLACAKDLATFLGLAERSVARYLWSLSGWHCIESLRHEERGRSETRWKLTQRGLRYLAASQRLPLVHVMQSDKDGAIWQPGVYILEKYLRHTAGVYSFLSAIHQAAQSEPNHTVEWFESHMHCARRYFYQKSWHNFRPDASVVYQQGTDKQLQRWVLWLEWDRATMTREQLRNKMLSYASYMRSREWRRFGYSAGIPLLLFVTSERGQADVLRELAEEILEGTQVQVYVTLRTLLEEQGFLAPIWFQAVPAQGSEKRSVLKKVFATT